MGAKKEVAKAVVKGFKEFAPNIKNYVKGTFGEVKQRQIYDMAKNNHSKFPIIERNLKTITNSTDDNVHQTLGLEIHKTLDDVSAETQQLHTASTVTSMPQGTSVKTQDTSGVVGTGEDIGENVITPDTIKSKFPITPANPKVITPTEARLRNKAMLDSGITEYEDELGMLWKRLGEGRWRNTTARNATRRKIDQITGLPGTRRNSTINYINKRSRDLVASNAEEVQHVNSIYSSRDAINQKLNLAKGDRNFMTVEHRISQSDWKKLGLAGNPHDSANLWLTTTYEATVKTTIENTLRKKAIKGNYIVDFNPQNNALHVMKLDNFKLNELPTGKRFKKNAKGEYNLQAIEEYLKTLE